MKGRFKEFFLGASGLAFTLLLWQAFTASGSFSPILLPPPSSVLFSLLEFWRDGSLWSGVAASLQRVVAGFLFSVILATPIGFLLGTNTFFRRAVGPVFLALKPIPPIAWIPLAILWFGLGDGPAYFLTMIASFFPILVNVAAGAENAGRRHIDVARSFGVGRRFVFLWVILPSALPYVITGYRVGFGVAWMAVIAAELVSAQSGLGYLIHLSQDMLRTDRAMAGMVLIGTIGLLCDLSFLFAQRKLLPWTRL